MKENQDILESLPSDTSFPDRGEGEVTSDQDEEPEDSPFMGEAPSSQTDGFSDELASVSFSYADLQTLAHMRPGVVSTLACLTLPQVCLKHFS